MSWIIMMCVIILLTCIEIYNFSKYKQTFRLLILIPFVLYGAVETPIAQFIPNFINIVIRICGIAFIIGYFWYVGKITKLAS